MITPESITALGFETNGQSFYRVFLPAGFDDTDVSIFSVFQHEQFWIASLSHLKDVVVLRTVPDIETLKQLYNIITGENL